MPGPTEEIGSTLRALIDAMRAQPAVLGLSLIIIAMLVFMFYALHAAGQFREALVNRVLANSENINTMLQQRAIACPDVPPTP